MANTVEQTKKKKWTKYLLIVCALIFTVNMTLISVYGTPSQSQSSVKVADPMVWADIYASQMVSGFLKAPSTADFARGTVKQLEGGIYEVSSYVDSQNSFGAMIRSPWKATLRFKGGDAAEGTNWRAEKIIFDGKVVYEYAGE